MAQPSNVYGVGDKVTVSDGKMRIITAIHYHGRDGHVTIITSGVVHA